MELKVTVKSTAAGGQLGLADSDVFYYGLAIGEGKSPSGAYAVVNPTDQVNARQNPHTPANRATVTDEYDYNRDSLVNPADEVIARGNLTTPANCLVLVKAPG